MPSTLTSTWTGSALLENIWHLLGYRHLLSRSWPAGARPEQLQDVAFPAMGGSVQPQNQFLAFSLKAPSDPATEKALFRSQGGSVGRHPVLVFSHVPSVQDGFLPLSRAAPLPPLASSRFCRCGRPLDPSGHNFGVTSETQRHPAQSLCLGRRCRFASSPQEERASVSRTLRCTWKSQTGCSRK